MSDRWEWVEIIEPRTKERMYANLTTGECVWEPPYGVPIKKTDQNQWWELFDQNTSRFYYYNATTQKTAWHRPHGCDIIPLAKLQTLKQNTEVSSRASELMPPVKREISTQTPSASSKTGDASQISSYNYSSTEQFGRHISRSHQRSHKMVGQVISSSPISLTKTDHNRGQGQGKSSTDEPVTRNSRASQSCITSNHPGHRGGGQDSTTAAVHRILESPRPQRSLDSQHTHRVAPEDSSAASSSSYEDQRMSPYMRQNQTDESPLHSPPHLHRHPAFFVRQDSYPFTTYDNPADYFGDLVGHYQDVSQITAVQVTPRPKPRAFPRTNPAYVGTRRNDGGQSYKKISVEQQNCQLPAVVYNQHFSEPHSSSSPHHYPPPPHPLSKTQMSQSYLSDAVDRRRKFHHERSDSDTSHSSFGIGRLQQNLMDGNSQSRPHRGRDEYSDSQSSAGSLRGINDAFSSHGSLRCAAQEKDGRVGVKMSPHGSLSSCSSLQHSADVAFQNNTAIVYQQIDHLHHHHRKEDFVKETQSAQGTPMVRVRARRNSEPDYANLPIITQLRGEKGTMADDERKADDIQVRAGLVNDEPRSGDSLPSADSLSPTEFCKRHDTPSSVRSSSTQNSEGLPDQGYEDSDNSSLFSSPSPKTRQRQNVGLFGFHASGRERRTTNEKMDQDATTTTTTTTSEKNRRREEEEDCVVQSFSLLLSHSEEDLTVDSSDGIHRQVAIEQFAVDNLNEHRKGFLGKAVPIGNMLTWTKDVITKPMIKTTDKIVKKESPEVFRLIQMYMLDRKAKVPLMHVALEVVTKGCSNVELRDEIYMQLCRQTTDNARNESLMRGWELIGICLSFFPSSVRFQSYLEGFLSRHLDPGHDTEKVFVSHVASHCQKRLERISRCGCQGSLRKPTLEKIEQALRTIFHPSMFGNTLEDVLQMQKERYPDRKLPWIQTMLSEEVLQLNGAQTEGIFRVPGDIDEVNSLKIHCDQWNVPSDFTEPHTPASLLKLWYRELYEPLIPRDFYDQCITSCSDSEASVNIVHSLPHINRLVLSYLIRFLQVFAAAENASVSKMDASNLAMVMAPNCLRCESDDPNVIFENTRKEMAFIRTLIENLDTSFMDSII